MSQADEAAQIFGPKVAAAAAVAGDPGVYQFTVDSSAVQVYVVPKDWKGSWIRIKASAEIQINFGTAVGDVNVVLNQVSATTGSGTAGSPFTMTPNDDTGDSIAADNPEPMIIHDSWTHFAVIAAAATTEVFIRRASDKFT